MSQLPGAEKYANWSKQELIAKLLNYENDQQNKIELSTTESEPAITTMVQNKPYDTAVTCSKRRKKNPRPFDMSKYSKRRIALKVAYFGWNYYGFETNANEKDHPTIEGQLYSAFFRSRLISDPAECNFTKCGRTDKGVSSLGQVIALNVRSHLPHDSPLVLPPESQDSNFNNKQAVEGDKESINTSADIGNTKNIEEIPYIEKLEAPSVVDDLLDILKTPAKPNYEMANELPLVLYNCQYDNVKWQYCRDDDATFNMPSKIYKHFYEQWNIHMTKTLILSTLLKDFGGTLLEQLKPNDREILQDKKKEFAENLDGTLEELVFSDTREEICSRKFINVVTGGGKETRIRHYIKLEKRQTCDTVESKSEKYAKRIKLVSEKYLEQ
ncbi:5249_t:CDS:2 [Acaulospora colombiana]|uniref:5249_t:CDS:1 n=1 Tax=Acaulospora colombiana TaxID=27376 RepID=A0ACA9MPT3_9GLOM|nr:5249_t:CDS:2 [Acaulospora colombiana]